MPEVPIRVHSAKGKPAPSSKFLRCCKACGADFLGLAAGKTGERGLWDDMAWYCSVECAPERLRPDSGSYVRSDEKGQVGP